MHIYKNLHYVSFPNNVTATDVMLPRQQPKNTFTKMLFE